MRFSGIRKHLSLGLRKHLAVPWVGYKLINVGASCLQCRRYWNARRVPSTQRWLHLRKWLAPILLPPGRAQGDAACEVKRECKLMLATHYEILNWRYPPALFVLCYFYMIFASRGNLGAFYLRWCRYSLCRPLISILCTMVESYGVIRPLWPILPYFLMMSFTCLWVHPALKLFMVYHCITHSHKLNSVRLHYSYLMVNLQINFMISIGWWARRGSDFLWGCIQRFVHAADSCQKKIPLCLSVLYLPSASLASVPEKGFQGTGLVSRWWPMPICFKVIELLPTNASLLSISYVFISWINHGHWE